VDFVVCTHLHVDHVGWNTRWQDGRWVPTFPNAKYVIAGAEWEFWKYENESGKEESGCIADRIGRAGRGPGRDPRLARLVILRRPRSPRRRPRPAR